MTTNIHTRKSVKYESLIYFSIPDIILASFHLKDLYLDSYGYYKDKREVFWDDSYIGEDINRELTTHGGRTQVVFSHNFNKLQLSHASILKILTFFSNCNPQEIRAKRFIVTPCSLCKHPQFLRTKSHLLPTGMVVQECQHG